MCREESDRICQSVQEKSCEIRQMVAGKYREIHQYVAGKKITLAANHTLENFAKVIHDIVKKSHELR